MKKLLSSASPIYIHYRLAAVFCFLLLLLQVREQGSCFVYQSRGESSMLQSPCVSVHAGIRAGCYLKDSAGPSMHTDNTTLACGTRTSLLKPKTTPPPYIRHFEEALICNAKVHIVPIISTKPTYKVLAIDTSCDETAAAVVDSDGTTLGNCISAQPTLYEKFGGIKPSDSMVSHYEAIDGTVYQAIRMAGLRSDSLIFFSTISPHFFAAFFDFWQVLTHEEPEQGFVSSRRRITSLFSTAVPKLKEHSSFSDGIASMKEIDVVAVTIGPGLEPCLRVGYEKAKELCVNHNIPMVFVNHLEAHCLSGMYAANLGFSRTDQAAINFPYLAVLASGGHTFITCVNGVANYSVMGTTVDDAVGEALDKAARYMGLPLSIPGGLAIDLAAKKGNAESFFFPDPLQYSRALNMSFSGLKTALKLILQGTKFSDTEYAEATRYLEAASKSLNFNEEIPPNKIFDLASAFQEAAFKHLIRNVKKAIQYCEAFTPIRSLVLVGGVAANSRLQRELTSLCRERGNFELRCHESEKLRNRLRRKIREALKKRKPLISSQSLTPSNTTFSPSDASNVYKSANFNYETEDTRLRRVYEVVTSGRHAVFDEKRWKTWDFVVPNVDLCRDNAIMIAWAAIEKLIERNGLTDAFNKDMPLLYPKWPLHEDMPGVSFDVETAVLRDITKLI